MKVIKQQSIRRLLTALAITFVSGNLSIAQQQTITLTRLDQRNVSYHAPSNFYSDPVVGLSTVGNDNTESLVYRAAGTWDVSSIEDWAFVIDGTIELTTGPQIPSQDFMIMLKKLSSDPRTLGGQNLYDDINRASSDKDLEIENNGGVSKPHPFSLPSSFLQYVEESLGSQSWIAAGLQSKNESNGIWCDLPFTDFEITKEIRISTSGTLTQEERWGGTVILTGDVIVPSGVTLKIWNGTTINLNDHALKNTGGTIEFFGGSGNTTFNPNVQLVSGGAVKGYYGSTSSALGDASSSDVVEIRSSETWNSSFTVNADVKIMSGGSVSINSGKTNLVK